MKYLLFLLGAMYIIGAIVFFMFLNNNNKVNIENSIVIIIPEEKLISYKNNPGGIFEEYKESGIGAGFFISTDGKIQTVNHIIENNKINYKIIFKNKEYKSEVISRNKEKDLAILKIITDEKIIFSSLKISKNIELNSQIIMSYGVDINNLKIISNTGKIINKNSKLDTMTNLLDISNPIKPGFSGGPILNEKSEVIGINYAISEGKNYGINLVEK